MASQFSFESFSLTTNEQEARASSPAALAVASVVPLEGEAPPGLLWRAGMGIRLRS